MVYLLKGSVLNINIPNHENGHNYDRFHDLDFFFGDQYILGRINIYKQLMVIGK